MDVGTRLDSVGARPGDCRGGDRRGGCHGGRERREVEGADDGKRSVGDGEAGRLGAYRFLWHPRFTCEDEEIRAVGLSEIKSEKQEPPVQSEEWSGGMLRERRLDGGVYDKTEFAIERIRFMAPHAERLYGGYTVMASGGKDSSVITDLAVRNGAKIKFEMA
jgi:hypothetical protein